MVNIEMAFSREIYVLIRISECFILQVLYQIFLKSFMIKFGLIDWNEFLTQILNTSRVFSKKISTHWED